MSMTLKPAAAAVPVAHCADRGWRPRVALDPMSGRNPFAAWLQARPHVPRHVAARSVA
jgi:hypothetical protein